MTTSISHVPPFYCKVCDRTISYKMFKNEHRQICKKPTINNDEDEKLKHQNIMELIGNMSLRLNLLQKQNKELTKRLEKIENDTYF